MSGAEDLKKAFREKYGAEPRLFRAPGRVNLIGEHTDYNDGFVMPCAIDRYTLVAVAPRADRVVSAFSQTLNSAAEFNLDDRPQPKDWMRYVEGVARVLQSRGIKLKGANLMISSGLPLGGGLSSSSALEIGVALAYLALCGQQLDAHELALVGQQAEHTYGGVMSGIMDQTICVLGRRGTALLLDCRSLETTYIPLDTSRMAIMICDSRVKHELAGSEYNKRRAECARGVELLARELPGIKALRDVTPEEFHRLESTLPEPIRRRCRHVVTENPRTLATAAALRSDDLREAGRLLYLSHESLRKDFEVSCAELDVLVQLAAQVEGVYGSRMTGGGFGGCTVTLLEPGAQQQFRDTVTAGYRASFALDPAIYEVQPVDGASEVGG